jgi:HTH-type transcriptional regulator/antitoxin HipB
MQSEQKTAKKIYSERRSTVTLDQLKDKALGTRCEPKREAYELEFREEIIAEMIKTLRQDKNLTQEQLANLMNINKSQVSRLEASQQGAKFETVIRALKALGAKRISFHVEMDDNKAFDYELASIV